MSRAPTNLIAIVGQPVRLFLLISSCTFAKCQNFRLDRAQYFVSGDRGCLYTEPGLDAGLDSFSLFRLFHLLQVTNLVPRAFPLKNAPPIFFKGKALGTRLTSYITIKRRVCRAIREGKLELGSWLGLGGLCVSVWLGLGGYELGYDSFLILLFYFVDLLLLLLFFSRTEKLEKS